MGEKIFSAIWFGTPLRKLEASPAWKRFLEVLMGGGAWEKCFGGCMRGCRVGWGGIGAWKRWWVARLGQCLEILFHFISWAGVLGKSTSEVAGMPIYRVLFGAAKCWLVHTGHCSCETSASATLPSHLGAGHSPQLCLEVTFSEVSGVQRVRKKKVRMSSDNDASRLWSYAILH